MATTPEQWAAQDEAFSKQYDAEQAQKTQQEAAAKADQPPSLMSQFGTALGTVSHVMLDQKITDAQAMFRLGRDAAAGAVTGATNTADAVVKGAAASGTGLAMAEDPEHAQAALEANLTSPVWDHAKAALLDFRDAVAVKDPTLADNLVQGVAQLAIPFAGYSRALSGVHGIANMVAAGALTDATALQPHDMRMADLIALGRTTEGKLGDVLRTLAPDGSALNTYINYLTDRKNESAAEGTFKNVLDGLGVNLVVTPLIAAAAATLKHGTAGLRYMVDNGVGSTSGMVPPPALQRGGPAASPSAARPAPRQITHEVEDGEHRLTSASGGYTHGQDVGRDIEVSTSFTPATARRQGEGTSRLETLARAAHDRGGVLRSGTTVSAAQASNYAQLEKRGYDVHRNAEATRNPETQGWLSGDPKLPVFVVRPRRPAAVGE